MTALPLRVRLKRRPVRGALPRYHNRIVGVLGQARGQRVTIRSFHADGVERRTGVGRIKLLSLNGQSFYPGIASQDTGGRSAPGDLPY
jgi:hypothetical protein